MGSLFKPDPLGIIDVTSALFIFMTTSFVPIEVLHVHAAVLITKGLGTMIRPVRLPFPVYVLGGMADVLSGAILFTGEPPLFTAYKQYLAVPLLIKGFWSLFGLMKKF